MELLAETGSERTRAGSVGERGSTMGRYGIVTALGRGAMGIVYLGEDPTIQRFVAIKTMRFGEVDDPSGSEEIQKRFFWEAESTGRLSHPHIATIGDAGEQDGLVFIAMDYLEGTTVTPWFRKGNLFPVAKAMEIVATVASALEYVHSWRVVHRDMKSANIILTKEKLEKVMDFGIARVTTAYLPLVQDRPRAAFGVEPGSSRSADQGPRNCRSDTVKGFVEPVSAGRQHGAGPPRMRAALASSAPAATGV